MATSWHWQITGRWLSIEYKAKRGVPLPHIEAHERHSRIRPLAAKLRVHPPRVLLALWEALLRDPRLGPPIAAPVVLNVEDGVDRVGELTGEGVVLEDELIVCASMREWDTTVGP